MASLVNVKEDETGYPKDDERVSPKEEGKVEQWLPDEVPGPSGVEIFKDKSENIEVKPELKQEVVAIIMEEEQEEESEQSDDDSDFDIKEEADSDEDSDSDESINFKQYICKNERKELEETLKKCQEDKIQENSADYEKVSVNINYTSTHVNEEPIENFSEIFKKSPLRSEKEKFHQQIFEQIMESSDKISLKDLQAQYIDQLRKAANIEIFSCSLCNYQTINLPKLKCHLLVIHNAKTKNYMFRCNQCDYQANFQSYMIKHLQSHKHLKKKYGRETKKEKHPCSECNYTGRSEDALSRHMSYVHKEKTINPRCELCPFESEDKDVLKEHKDTHKAGHKFKCYECEYKNNNKLQVGLHLLKVHNVANEMSERCKICEICSHSFNNMNQLRKHLLTHKDISELSESEIYKCPECNHQTKYKEQIKLHMSVHKDPEFVCEICGFSTRHKKSYKEHLITHKNWDEIEWFRCELCPYQGRTRKLLYKHMKGGNHSGKKLRKRPEEKLKQEKAACDLCAFETDKKTLKEHTDTHKEGNRYKCFKCDYLNMSKLQVGIHLLNVHKIENEASKKSKICEVCSLSFSNTNHLKRHLMSHKDISELNDNEIYKCSLCDHQFKYERSFKLHMLVHKDPEFICEVCGFTTRHKKSYKEHLTIHKNFDEIDWFKCKICPYQARNRKLLWAHMKKGDHSGKYVAHVPHVRNRTRVRLVKEKLVKPETVGLAEEKAQLIRIHDIFPHSIF